MQSAARMAIAVAAAAAECGKLVFQVLQGFQRPAARAVENWIELGQFVRLEWALSR